ncbi:hemin-degrading factor [Erwinia amylovora]|uniref:Iron chelate transport protein n=3 Tax=Erwinia amylovora TaxID=552 RepID=A0A831A2D7_ERWAM|nr:hemin-degrading factor [Erwinia amylovora]CDK15164.1 Iron chelate transport protein [Erwinia amylovora LA635]CDK18531.1 Iron chelate transport protein [Erwinia amylovora LA636]CDK21900.1 Iron chelate transport protein [Erwinia amylovora LA637]ATZ11473.1 hemin-degrading factor [Erwinia amylovora]EKV54369.1 Iron chelate transport protein [Erwinia amylovora ACW56400]
MIARYQRFLELKAQYPQKHARELAALMGIAEAELVAARVGHQAQPLRPQMRELLHALEAVGETKCVTRNEYAVHEHLGVFSHVRINEHAGMVLNPRALDLRVLINQWASVWHVREITGHGAHQSIQFFDLYGDAVLKVYATAHTHLEAWQQLIDKFRRTDGAAFSVAPAVAARFAGEFDAGQAEKEWRAMTDVHQFFRLLKKHDVSRQQLFHAVSNDLAQQVGNQSLSYLLETVQQQGNEIMIFVSNRGCTQIFTGKIARLVPKDNWLNIFNPAFTLHVQEHHIAESWITRKPTAEGIVTSLELFAADGTQIAQLYGQRSEGQPEQSTWRSQLACLTADGIAV